MGVGLHERPSPAHRRHVTEVRTFAQTVEAIAERLGDAPLQIAAQYYLAAASYLSGDYRADRTGLPDTDAVATRPADP